MPHPPSLLLLVTSTLLVACSSPRALGPGVPGQYAQSMDSATNACLRNPSCYIAPPGEDAILPWVSRSLAAARTAAAAVHLMKAEELAHVVQVLKDCANEASVQVDKEWLGEGRRPDRKLCQETYKTERGGKAVTWAAHLGREKHLVALACVKRDLRKGLEENVSLQPHYRYHRKQGKIELLDPLQVAEWLRDGLFGQLLGTLIPDVVVHASGNPHRIQDVFDFKFPCPPDNNPSWYVYAEGHPYQGLNQGRIYKEAFKVDQPARIAPGFGAVR